MGGGKGETLERGAAAAADVDGVIGQLRQELVALGAPHHPYLLLLLLRSRRRSRARALGRLHAQCREHLACSAFSPPLSTRSQQQPPPPHQWEEEARRRGPPPGERTEPGPREKEQCVRERRELKEGGGKMPRRAGGEEPRGVSSAMRRRARLQEGGRGRRRGDRDKARTTPRFLSL